MKAEDVARLYNESGMLEADMEWIDLTWPTRRALIAFARACEQHGIERAKALLRVNWHEQEEDWSALDAEIAKENEDG